MDKNLLERKSDCGCGTLGCEREKRRMTRAVYVGSLSRPRGCVQQLLHGFHRGCLTAVVRLSSLAARLRKTQVLGRQQMNCMKARGM